MSQAPVHSSRTLKIRGRNLPAVAQSSSESVVDEMLSAPGGISPFLVEAGSSTKPRHKKLVRRIDREYSQPLRLGVQLFLVALNAWIGVQFYLWVHWAESGGRAAEVSRPPGVEGWLPIEGFMQLKYFVLTRRLPQLHAAGFFLFV